jgi:uncharacterized protein (TIGR00369 family)
MNTSEEHYRKLERLYVAAPTNEYYKPSISVAHGAAEVRIEVRPDFFHAAAAVHGAIYFKLLDDAAFFATNSLVPDVFVLTANYTINLLRPVSQGILTAHGQVLSAGKRQFLSEAKLFNSESVLVGHGSGTFVRSSIPLGPEVGYL